MITVSNEYKQLIQNDKRKFIVTVEMRLADGTQLTIGNDKIMNDGIQFDDAVGEDNTFSAIGSAIINSFTLVLNNIYEDFSDYDFTDAKITKILFGLELSNGTIETLEKAAVDDSVSQTREVYTVDETSYNGATITLTCLDNMSKFDRPYSETTLIYPTRLDNIIIDACQKCGVTLAASSVNFPRYNFEVTERPAQETTSFREVISWVATIAGCFARCNTAGELELKWFDTNTLEQSTDIDNNTWNYVKPSMMIDDEFQNNGLTVEYTDDGWWHVYGERANNSAIRFDLYEDVLDETSGSYTFQLETRGFTTAQEPKIGYLCYPQQDQLVSWSSHASPYTTNVYSLPILGLAFWERTGSALPPYDGFVKFSVVKASQEPNIYGLYSQDIGTDDVVITKVSARIRSNDTPTDHEVISVDGIVSYSTGTDGYEIVIENNQFITVSNIKTVVNYLGNQLIGLRFRRLNVTHLSDPTIEAGDIAYVWDRKNNKYSILITRTAFSISGSQTTVCGASTPLRNSAKRFVETTKSYVELRKQIQEVRNPYAKALSDLAEAVQQAGGMYETKITQPDGSVITYKHNMPDLILSDKQIAITDVGMTFTTNGTDANPIWYGHTVDGRVVASILDAAGINAEWIRTGQLIVLDPSGNETFFADYATGIVRINATQFKVIVDNQSKTVQQITDDAINSIEIGNRNLIRGTSDTNQYDKWAFLRSAVWEDEIIRLTPNTSGSYARRIIDYLPYGEYKDQEYVLSFDAKIVDPEYYDTVEPNLITGTTGTNGKYAELNGSEYHIFSSYYYFTEEGQALLAGNTDDYITVSFDYQVIGAEPASDEGVFIYAQINNSQGNAQRIYVSPNESGHAVCTFNLTSTQASYENRYRLRFRLRYTVEGACIRITHPKVVIGTEDTPWVPSAGEPSYDSVVMPDKMTAYMGVITPDRNATATNFVSEYERYINKTISLVQNFQWNRYSLSYIVPDDFTLGPEEVLVDENYLQIQLGLGANKYAIDIRNVKLAKGNKSTDYSEAPEDLVEGTVIHYGSPDLITPIDYTLNDGDYLIDELTGQTYRWDADSKQWMLVTDYQESINEATDTLRTEINQTIDGVKIEVTQTSNDLDELKMHYRFDAEGETIGKSGSDKSIRLANDGINMMVNEDSVTKWNQDEMYTPIKVMVPVGGSLQLGDFVFQPRTNGNMSLFYVGDD